MRSNNRANSAIFLSCLFLWSSLAASCRSSKPPKDKSSTVVGQTRVDQVLVQLEDAPPGLHVRLSEGKLGIDRAGDRVKLVPAVKLPEPAAAKLLDRMPKLVGEKDDRKDFAVRDKSMPPPQTGNTIKG